MSLNGGIPLGGQPVMPMVTPLNDIQLVALIASNLNGDSPSDLVAFAIELVAESIIQMDGFNEILKQKQREKLRSAQE